MNYIFAWIYTEVVKQLFTYNWTFQFLLQLTDVLSGNGDDENGLLIKIFVDYDLLETIFERKY